MSVEHIRLSQPAKDQLIQLKRKTGIKNWNVLCRWAFCVSLAYTKPPPPLNVPLDSSVEMSWKVFGGQYHEIYLALLKVRCQADGLGTSDDILGNQLRCHLHRGISILANDKTVESISSLMRKSILPATGPNGSIV